MTDEIPCSALKRKWGCIFDRSAASSARVSSAASCAAVRSRRTDSRQLSHASVPATSAAYTSRLNGSHGDGVPLDLLQQRNAGRPIPKSCRSTMISALCVTMKTGAPAL